MENEKVKIIGTGLLNHYKDGELYEISKARLNTIPKDSYKLAQSEAPLFDGQKEVTKPVVKVVPKPEDGPKAN